MELLTKCCSTQLHRTVNPNDRVIIRYGIGTVESVYCDLAFVRADIGQVWLVEVGHPTFSVSDLYPGILCVIPD